jgi:hypothetical protein
MKIARLKRRADAAEADARNKWLEFRTHSRRSLAVVRRRVGGTAGLAISFSLGFMTGTATRRGKTDAPQVADDGEPTAEQGRGIAYKLAHGPLGDTVIRLGIALVARSLVDFLNEARDDEAGLSESVAASADAQST